MTEKTILEMFIELINSKPIGDIITRTELKAMYCENRGLDSTISTGMDTIRVYFTMTKYLEKERGYGRYRVLKHVPENFNMNQELKQAQREKLNNVLNVQAGGDHYLQMTYQPIELIAKLRLSYIQGNVVKYLARYKNKNGLNDLQKALQYIEMAPIMGETRGPSQTHVGELTRFINENQITHIEGMIIRDAIACKWDRAAAYCKELIKLEYGVNIN